MPIDTRRAKKTSVPGVQRLKDGRFLVVTTWIDRRTGRKKARRAIANSMEEAKRLRVELRGAPAKEGSTRTRLLDFAERWLVAKAAGLAPATRERYLSSVARFSEGLGDVFLDALDAEAIRFWQREVTTTGFAARTTNGWIRVLRQVLEQACEEGLIGSNPARRVKALREAATSGRRAATLTVNEYRSFVEATERMAGAAIPADVAGMILALGWTGCRVSEIRALRWADYDSDRAELVIRRSVSKGEERSTKSGDPRVVPVVEPLAKALKDQRARLLEAQHPALVSDLMFPAAKVGRRAKWFRSTATVAEAILRVCAEARVPELSPHALRRTFERLLLRADVDATVRRSMAGWRSAEVQNVYASVDRDDRARAGAAILRLVNGPEIGADGNTSSNTPEEKGTGAVSPSRS